MFWKKKKKTKLDPEPQQPQKQVIVVDEEGDEQMPNSQPEVIDLTVDDRVEQKKLNTSSVSTSAVPLSFKHQVEKAYKRFEGDDASNYEWLNGMSRNHI